MAKEKAPIAHVVVHGVHHKTTIVTQYSRDWVDDPIDEAGRILAEPSVTFGVIKPPICVVTAQRPRERSSSTDQAWFSMSVKLRKRPASAAMAPTMEEVGR